ncbi:MAG: Flp family type IVb pilin [Acidimicrobiales bacterium]
MTTNFRSQSSETTTERGATAVEYSILVVLIAALIVLTVEAVGVDVAGLWASVNW